LKNTFHRISSFQIQIHHYKKKLSIKPLGGIMKKKIIQLMISVTLIFFLMPQKSSSQNLLVDGNFDTTTSIPPFYGDPTPLFQWCHLAGTSASFTTNVQNGIVSYLIDNAGTGMWEVQLDQFGFSLQANHRYRLSFDVKADADRDFGVFIGEYEGNWTNLNPAYMRHVTSDWQTITIDLNSLSVFPSYQLSFEMGAQKINMYLRNISLIDLGPIPVDIAGTFQSELGCANNWMPDCDNTALTYNSSTALWSGSFNIPAGCHQYKVTIGGSWDINYGENGIQNGANINLFVPTQTLITFIYDPVTHLVTTSPIASGFSTNCLPQVVLTGSFQSALGCGSDWDANCTNTALIYSVATGMFENDLNIPPGYYEYRAILNNDWYGNNFGVDGVPNGGNYSFYICQPTIVHFSYDPMTHIVTNNLNAQPNTVVIAGSFQNEIGCTGDWQPDCNNTRMRYNAVDGTWIDTLNIPAGHWEYKITINNSWTENYGLNGQPDGPNISLDLCYPAKVIFTYSHSNCYHSIYSQIITNGVCVNKFYDANVNGYPDPGEEPIGGITFTLTGNGITQTQVTGSDGKAAFTNFPDGVYVIKETVPSGYYSSGIDSQYVYLFGGNVVANFGNVCIGPGGAKGIGFWANKNGETALNNSGKLQDALWWLRYWGLRNADGTDFDPYTYDQLKSWMLGANAKNITYMLSAQLAAMFLNVELGYVDQYNSYIYTPGCSWWGNFMNVSNLIWYTNYYLWYSTTVDGKNPERGYLNCLKTAFDNANNNLTFVQPHPCNGTITKAETGQQEVNSIYPSPVAKLWPNPSSNYFTLRPAENGNVETIQLRVFNINGQLVYETNGSSNKDYHFGEKFIPGIYMAEFIEGNNKKTFKLVKQ
jgi:hypothetical protein